MEGSTIVGVGSRVTVVMVREDTCEKQLDITCCREPCDVACEVAYRVSRSHRCFCRNEQRRHSIKGMEMQIALDDGRECISEIVHGGDLMVELCLENSLTTTLNIL